MFDGNLPDAVRQPCRGHFGELSGTLPDGRGVHEVLNDLADCLPRSYVAMDRKGRGTALNNDLYGWDAEAGIAVVQVRQSTRLAATHFHNTRKTYVLCGRNENGTAFRHPVSAHAVRAAVNRGADAAETVRAAQCWMWEVTAAQLAAGRRQGDILIVPERSLPRGTAIEYGTEGRLAGSHIVRADRVVTVKGRVYAISPRLIHTKREHKMVRAPVRGWCSVRVARDAPAWSFSQRTAD